MELFNKQESHQDQHVEGLDYVTSQCNYLAEQEAMNLNFQCDHQIDRVRISASSMQIDFCEENKEKDSFWSENVKETSFASEEHQGDDKNGVKQENGRSDSISNCSDQFDDEDDDSGKCRSRTSGRGPPAKNLAAERRRRKKLNDRLYTLRALVPKISKLDKASILVDAISYVEELQNQVKEQQEELEERSEDNRQGPIRPDKRHSNESHVGAKQNKNPQLGSDKVPQMEVQVQVAQIDDKEFFVKVFCEQKHGGFANLLEALDSLGLEVTNANVTSFRSLVSNVLKVEKKKDGEIIQADYVRESLLELTRDPPNGWSTEMARPSDNFPHHHQINEGYINHSNHQIFHQIHD